MRSRPQGKSGGLKCASCGNGRSWAKTPSSPRSLGKGSDLGTRGVRDTVGRQAIISLARGRRQMESGLKSWKLQCGKGLSWAGCEKRPRRGGGGPLSWAARAENSPSTRIPLASRGCRPPIQSYHWPGGDLLGKGQELQAACKV